MAVNTKRKLYTNIQFYSLLNTKCNILFLCLHPTMQYKLLFKMYIFYMCLVVSQWTRSFICFCKSWVHLFFVIWILICDMICIFSLSACYMWIFFWIYLDRVGLFCAWSFYEALSDSNLEASICEKSPLLLLSTGFCSLDLVLSLFMNWYVVV